MEHETISAVTTAASALADAASTAGAFIAPVAEGLLHVASKVPVVGEAANLVKDLIAACRDLGMNQQYFDQVVKCLNIAVQWAEAAHGSPAALLQPLVVTCLNALENSIKKVAEVVNGKLSHLKSGALGTAKGLTITEQDKKVIDLALDSLNRPILYLSGAMSATGCLATNALEALYAEFEKPIVSDSEWTALADQFHPGTRVALREQVFAWINKEPSTGSRAIGADVLFWIHADAGVGKTVFAASVVKELEQKGRLAGAFLFKFNDASRTPMAAMKSLAHQIARRFPVLQESILHGVKMLKTRYDGFESLGRVFRELVAGPLSELPGLLRMISVDQSNELQPHLLKKTKVIVLDGLDEINATLRSELLNFFSSSRAANLLLATNLRLIVASRRSEKLGLGDIIRCFDAPRAASAPIADTEEDIRVFCRWKLNALGFPEQFMNDAVDLIVKNSGMRFVYMKMVDKALTAVAETIATVSSASDLHEAVHDVLKRLPVSVDDCYQKYMDQLKEALDVEFVMHSARDRVWALLGVLIACKQPLTGQLAGVIFEDMAPASVITIAKHLDVVYPLKDGHFQPIHMSFVDWIDKNSRYHSLSGEGHLMLVKFLLGVLKECMDRSVSSHGEPHRFFREYCSNHLVEHMLALDYFSKAYELVTDLPWIQWKLVNFGPKSVIADLRSLSAVSDQPDLAHIHQGTAALMQCFEQNMVRFDAKDSYRDICTKLTCSLRIEQGNDSIDRLQRAAVNWLQVNGGVVVYGDMDHLNSSVAVELVLPVNFVMALYVVSPSIVVVVSYNSLDFSSGFVATWNLEIGNCIFRKDIGSVGINWIACAVDGDRIACAGDDCRIVVISYLFEAVDVVVSNDLEGPVSVMRYLGDGLMIYCCQQVVRVANTRTGTQMYVLPLIELSSSVFIHSIDTNQGQRTAIAVGNTISVWSITPLECSDISTNSFHGYPHLKKIVFIGSLPDGRMITVSKDCVMFIWSSEFSPTLVLDNAEYETDGVIWVSVLSRGVILSFDCEVLFWSIDDPSNPLKLLSCPGCCDCCEVSDSVLLCLDVHRHLHLLNISTGEPSIELSAEACCVGCDRDHVLLCLRDEVLVFRKAQFHWPSITDLMQRKKHLSLSVSSSWYSDCWYVTSIQYCSSNAVVTTTHLLNTIDIRVWDISNGSWKGVICPSNVYGKCFAWPSANVGDACVGVLQLPAEYEGTDVGLTITPQEVDCVTPRECKAGLSINGKLTIGSVVWTHASTTSIGDHGDQFCFDVFVAGLSGPGEFHSGVLDLSNPLFEVSGVGTWDLSLSGLVVQQGDHLQYWRNSDWDVGYQWAHNQHRLNRVHVSIDWDNVCIAERNNGILVLWDLSAMTTWTIDSFEQFMVSDDCCYGIDVAGGWSDVPQFGVQSFSECRVFKVRPSAHTASTRCIIAQGFHCHIIEYSNGSISHPVLEIKPSLFVSTTIFARNAACAEAELAPQDQDDGDHCIESVSSERLIGDSKRIEDNSMASFIMVVALSVALGRAVLLLGGLLLFGGSCALFMQCFVFDQTPPPDGPNCDPACGSSASLECASDDDSLFVDDEDDECVDLPQDINQRKMPNNLNRPNDILLDIEQMIVSALFSQPSLYSSNAHEISSFEQMIEQASSLGVSDTSLIAFRAKIFADVLRHTVVDNIAILNWHDQYDGLQIVLSDSISYNRAQCLARLLRVVGYVNISCTESVQLSSSSLPAIADAGCCINAVANTFSAWYPNLPVFLCHFPTQSHPIITFLVSTTCKEQAQADIDMLITKQMLLHNLTDSSAYEQVAQSIQVICGIVCERSRRLLAKPGQMITIAGGNGDMYKMTHKSDYVFVADVRSPIDSNFRSIHSIESDFVPHFQSFDTADVASKNISPRICSRISSYLKNTAGDVFFLTTAHKICKPLRICRADTCHGYLNSTFDCSCDKMYKPIGEMWPMFEFRNASFCHSIAYNGKVKYDALLKADQKPGIGGGNVTLAGCSDVLIGSVHSVHVFSTIEGDSLTKCIGAYHRNNPSLPLVKDFMVPVFCCKNGRRIDCNVVGFGHRCKAMVSEDSVYQVVYYATYTFPIGAAHDDPPLVDGDSGLAFYCTHSSKLHSIFAAELLVPDNPPALLTYLLTPAHLALHQANRILQVKKGKDYARLSFIEGVTEDVLCAVA